MTTFNLTNDLSHGDPRVNSDLRSREEARWAKIKTPGRIEFVVLVVTGMEFAAMRSAWGEYSTSLPTGIIVGKRWVRNANVLTRLPPEWWMGEIVAHAEDPRLASIRWTPIAIER